MSSERHHATEYPAGTAARRLAGEDEFTRESDTIPEDVASVPPLLDAQEGRITRVVLAVPRRAALHREDALRHVLRALPHRASLDVVVAPEVLDKVSGWIDETGPGALACLIQAHEGAGFPLWMQDMILARTDDSLLLTQSQAGGQQAADVLAKGADLQVAPLGATVSGGNVLPCGKLLLIGAEAVAQSGLEADALAQLLDPNRYPVVLGTSEPLPAEQAQPMDDRGPRWIETRYWRCSGKSHQPMPHLDLFVAPAGETRDGQPRFLVGCPRRGADILGHSLEVHAMARAFDEVAVQLADLGAHVIRNPLPLISRDDSTRRRRTWFHLPVNNVIVECASPMERRVLLPCFASPDRPDLAEIDSVNAAVWAWLGYSVTRVEGMLQLAEGFGGPRRVMQVSARA